MRNLSELLKNAIQRSDSDLHRQVYFFNFSIAFYTIWLILFVLWWTFSDEDKPQGSKGIKARQIKPRRYYYYLIAPFLFLMSLQSKAQECDCNLRPLDQRCYDYCCERFPKLSICKDSSVIPSRSMPQHTEFMQGTYNFPAKPRNMWELGLKLGSFMVSGDVPAKFPGFGFGAHIRKALGYVFSLRLEYIYGIGKGLNWNANSGGAIVNNSVLRSAPLSYTGADKVFMNYKTNVQDLALEGVVTFNNIRFHKAKSGFNVYGLIGIGATTYDTKYNLQNGSTRVDFSGISGNVYENRKETKGAIEAKLDDTYETPAENEGNRRPKLGGNTLLPVGHFGVGVAFRLNKRVNIAIEDRYTITRSDLIDGQRWSEQGSLTPDYDAYNYATVGLNINLGAKPVEPLWWLNPLDYAYQEIRKPRLMILPKPVLLDTDGDGVTDQFDQEVTPAGCPVDAHGVSLDTDGDGVPDCRDKEKITPSTWQPVDADGVGKAPCPDSCWGNNYMAGKHSSNLGIMPSISFQSNFSKLTTLQKRLLTDLATRLRYSPDAHIRIVDYCTGSSKAMQYSGIVRAENIRKYLVESEGIANDRITMLLAQEGGDCNTIDLQQVVPGEGNVPFTGEFDYVIVTNPQGADIYLIPENDLVKELKNRFGRSFEEFKKKFSPSELDQLKNYLQGKPTSNKYKVLEEPYIVIGTSGGKVDIKYISPKRRNPEGNRTTVNPK